MEQLDQDAEPHFSPPFRQILLMVSVLGLSGFVVFLALPRILPVFEANPYLNGFILFVFVIGVLACFWQVAQLFNSVRWIETFASGSGEDDGNRAPRLLAPLAALLRARDTRMQISSSSTRSILDSVATRIDEAREITRYIVSLLIFLGLLGTFYGLATTVPALVDTIRGLAPQDGESGVDVFGRLMSGLEAQLSGMGVAFGSSLLGLAGSLVVGLLELFSGHGQNRFYRELEEWLSTITRVTFSTGEGDGEGESSGEYGAAVQILDHMLEQMDRMRGLFEQSEQSRGQVDARLGSLADSVERLTDRMAGNRPVTDALERVADGQERLINVMSEREDSEGLDAESRMRLRSIDVQLLRILEEISAGRQETMAELRMDIASLTRLVAQSRIAEADHPHVRPTRPKGREG
ncbi:MAG: biopolymer transporter ExbB [Thalassovita sp.]